MGQNLASALYAIMSPSILPYILTLDTCVEILSTIERWLQSTNMVGIIQLKYELHNLTMVNKSMQQYLSKIKAKVDSIAASGSPINSEAMIIYILNGLPPSYQAFKVAIIPNL